MYRKVWSKCQAAVCAINFFSEKGIRFNSVTGFRHGRYIVTDEMVYKIDKASEVQISFFEDDGCTVKTSVKITEKDFKMRIVKGIRENIGGFALIDIDLPQFDDIPSLAFSPFKKSTVASPIAVIGYHFHHANLAIKTGIVSSFTRSNGTKYIQFDAAVDRGNSGSPLIDVETCDVVGIVGRNLATILDSYNKLNKIMNTNLEVLKNAEGKIMMGDIDPVQVLIANQNQIKHLAQEFFRNASLNFGFALDINEVSEYLDIDELERKGVPVNAN
jgi:hypothetical protein